MKNALFDTMTNLWLLLVACSLFGVPATAATYSLTVDGGVSQGVIPHFWSKCVGTGTMEYCLKPAWQKAARIGVQEAGFEYVRGHGILIHLNNVDNIKVLSWNGAGSTPTYNWSKIDEIYDTVLSCGLKPIVELSFMPPALQTNTPASKPKDWTVWENFIAALITHWEEHFGLEEVRSWYFEVWNEYDYQGFWKDTPQDYYELYKRTVAGIKRTDPDLLVGGPASTNPAPLQPFLEYCKNNNVEVDFVSNHLYGGPSGDTSYAVGIRNDNRERAKTIKNSGLKLLSFNTEFNSNYSGQGGYETAANCVSMDSHQNAPFVAKVVKLIMDDYISGLHPLPDVLSYWALSDCFDESGVNNGNSYIEFKNGIPFAQVFGLINYQGVRKATFNTYRMLHRMGTAGLKVSGGSGESDGVDGFAMLNKDSTEVAVMVYNYYFNLRNSGPADNVTLQLTNLPFAPNQGITVRHYRIDETHSNPYGIWVRLGKKVSPSAAEWDSIRAHEVLEEIEPESVVQFDGSPISKSFTMPRWSVSLLTFTRDATEARSPDRHTMRPGNGSLILNGTTLTAHSCLRGPLTVSVYGADGRLVWRVTTLQRSINLYDGLTKGMYLVRAEADGIRLMKRMVVSR